MPIDILGVKIDTVDSSQAVSLIDQFLHDGKKHQIVTVNPEFIVLARKNQEFKKVLNASDLRLADGSGILFAAFLLYGRKIKRLPGTDLLLKLAELSYKRKYKVFLLGSNPSWVCKETAKILKAKFPNLSVEAHPGSRDIANEKGEEKGEIIKAINNFKPDILFVAYGAPYQDTWIGQNLSLLNVKVAMGVGGAFNYIIGKSYRAPRLLRSLGLEWLWRLVFEPYRWRRIVNAVVVFPWLVLREKFKRYSNFPI